MLNSILDNFMIYFYLKENFHKYICKKNPQFIPMWSFLFYTSPLFKQKQLFVASLSHS